MLDDATRVLAILWRKRESPPAEGELQDVLDRFYDEEAPKGPGVVAALRAQGRVARDALVVTDPSEGRAAAKAVMTRGFDEALVELATSTAFRTYNERVNGWSRFSFDMVDGPQRDALIAAAGLSEGARFVDLGCATGAFTDWLAESTGASGLGVDFAPSAIALGRERYPRCRFEVQDLDALDLPAAAFDVAIAIDTLYFPEDLEQSLRRVFEVLEPGGRLVALYSRSAAKGEKGSALAFIDTPLGQALASLGVSTTTLDVTDGAARVWRAGERALAELEHAFAAEGMTARWKRLMAENDVQLASVEEGRTRRWLVTSTRS